MSEDILNKLWVEKYRPHTLDEVKLEVDQKEFLRKCINDEEVPHLLLVGPPGSGKTTTARIINDAIIKDEMDILPLNGSSSTGIDVVRNDIESFLKSPAMQSKLKIVFIDEFDFMSQNAQGSLRHIFEKYSEVGRFICTANYKSKIMDALHSRFQTFEMKTISIDFALKYCTDILDKEEVQYEKENVELIVQAMVPDIRKIVGTLQRNVVDGVLKGVTKESVITLENKIIGDICMICDAIGTHEQNRVINQKVPEIQKAFSDGEPDYYSVYSTLFHSNIPIWAKITVNKYSESHQSAFLPSMHLVAMVYEIIMNGKQFHATFGLD